MCPDKSLLSAYYDNEINEPWKSELQIHLESCESCRSRLKAYGGVSLFLKKDGDSTCDTSSPVLYSRVMQLHRRNIILPFWEKRNLWPLSAAAVLILSLSLLVSLPAQRDSSRLDSFVLLDHVSSDLSAMDNLVPIMLPPEHKFSYYGDSQLIKAAGFDGSVIP